MDAAQLAASEINLIQKRLAAAGWYEQAGSDEDGFK
jgi:hypothetical protein